MLNHRFRGLMVRLFVGLVPFGASACSGQDVSPEVSTSALYEGPSTALWPGGQVPICFVNLPSSNEAQWLKSALQDSWTAVANIDFTYSNTCPFAGKTNYVRFTLAMDTQWRVGGATSLPVGMHGGTHDFNVGYCTTADCTGAHFVDYREAFKQSAVHEVGHILGFAHERIPS